MSKRPSFQFYTGDWLKDPNLGRCSAATRGIWIDLLALMHENDRSGELTGTVVSLSQVCRCSAEEMETALMELQDTGAADILEGDKSGTCPADVRNCPGLVRVVNRRMFREEKGRKNGRLKKRRQRSSKAVPDDVPKMSRPPSSSSTSVTLIVPSVLFEQFWAVYPKKRSKGQARKAWDKLNPDEQLLTRILDAVERAKTSGDWAKDGGKFIPYPATWLNAEGWLDEVQPAAPEPSFRDVN